jgi:hypothetical protein
MTTELEREGLLWLARQLEWERRFEQLRQAFDANVQATGQPDPQKAAA